MAKERDFVSEILSIQSRNRYEQYFHSIIMRLENLETLYYGSENLNDEMLKYFPIGLVACTEGYYRAVIKQLIDFGGDYLNNASKLKTQFDFNIVKAVHQKTITLGDFIAHLSRINNLDDINSNLSILTAKDFLEELKKVYDRYEVEVLQQEKKLIIENPTEIYNGIKKTFELRHIYAHEIADDSKLEKADIDICFKSVKLMMKATSEFVSELLYPNAPLTQVAITQSAIDDYEEEVAKIEILENEIEALLEDDDLKKFKEMQEWWNESNREDSEFSADIGGKGGTIWKTLYFSELKNGANKRIDYLMDLLNYLKKDYPL